MGGGGVWGMGYGGGVCGEDVVGGRRCVGVGAEGRWEERRKRVKGRGGEIGSERGGERGEGVAC